MAHPVQYRTLNHRVPFRYLFQIVFVFLAYVIAGKLGQATANIRSSNLGPVWPAYGVALAAILIWGYRVWPGVAAGTFFVAFLSPVSHLAALGQATGSTLAAVTGTFLLHRIGKFDRSLSRLSDVLGLIALGGFGSAVVSASIGVLVLYANHVHAYSGWGAAWVIYWLGDATGVLLVTPFVLRFRDLLGLGGGRIRELVLLVLLLATACFVVFGDLPYFPVKLHVMAFSVLPFIMWAAIRYSIGITCLSILIVSTIATIETAFGSGPFIANSTFINAVLLDVFFAVIAVSCLSLAAVISERERAERERQEVISRQAAIEARLGVDHALRESEERLRLAAQVGRMFAYSWDAATDRIERSGECGDILGLRNNEAATGDAVAAMVHPDDRARVDVAMTKLTVASPDLRITYRIVRPDGVLKWIERKSHAYFDAEGRVQRIVGMVRDVTEQKRAEQALEDVTRKLLQAQEQERARIGRELHDDINQRIAMLIIELQKLEQTPSDLETWSRELCQRLTELADDVQALSHELHSSKLEYLGAVRAIRSWCNEFGQRRHLEIDVKTDVRSVLPFEIGVCLFRVLQEALHNADKYSGVKHIDVELTEESDEVHLIVRDQGQGFDVESTLQGTGLGLTSMRERVRLVNGIINIDSNPMQGTIVHVRVPIANFGSSQRAAG